MSSNRHLPGRARTDLLGRTVLLVEDDFFEARDMRQALQHAGASVVGPFADSAAALRAINTREISCAILDLRLNDGTRFNLAGALQDKGIPFLFLTGLSQEMVPETMKQIPFFQKPGEIRGLLKVTSQICADRYF